LLIALLNPAFSQVFSSSSQVPPTATPAVGNINPKQRRRAKLAFFQRASGEMAGN
jgi:hypothetical protein